MDELVYDPTTKQKIKDRIYEHLYNPVRANFQKRLDTLIQENSMKQGNGQRFMFFRNEVYSMTDPGPQPLTLNRCHSAIKPMMKEYVADLDHLNQTELPYVMGFITQVLNSSNSLQDYFKLLPESVHRPIQELVDNCGCKTCYLDDQAIHKIQEKNRLSINLMKERMVYNLLL